VSKVVIFSIEWEDKLWFMALLLNLLWTGKSCAVVKLKYISGLHSCTHSSYTTKWSNRLVIVSGRSTGDHVTRDFADTCCHRQEIPASQSSRWYHRLRIDVTSLLPTPSITVSERWWRLWRGKTLVHESAARGHGEWGYEGKTQRYDGTMGH